MKALVNWLLKRHPDGTKHQWIHHQVGTHWCSWDYCHCYRRECIMCGKEEFMSDGTVEMR